ncbi:MAG: cache domain-containing protein [Thermodesulfovibrio sp.]|nr:hypothetical protein [Thermodesulfovibrio sp.]MDW7998679.1 cache domain-containing protein [Thermodesulfovibrio sp.]
MKKNFSLKTFLIMPVVVTLSVGMTLLIFLNYLVYESLIREEREKIESIVNIVQVYLETATMHYQKMAALVAHMPDVQEAVSKKDRNRLIDKFLSSFNYLRDNFDLAQIHFHIPPAVSLLRLHNIEHFGDDISKNRKTVVQVEATQKGVRGFEIGLGGAGLRGVEPIFYRDTYVGSVDFGGGMKKEVEQIKKLIDAEVGIAIRKELLSSWTGLKDIKHSFGEWISLHFTGKEPKLFISEKSLKTAESSIDKYHIDRVSISGKDYTIIYSPLKDFSGNKAGFVYIVKEKILSSNTVFTILGINLIVYIIMLILSVLLIRKVMNRYIIEPIVTLINITDEISTGRTSQKVSIVDSKGEITELVNAIEKVRISMRKLFQ